MRVRLVDCEVRLWGVAGRFKPANPRSPTPSTSAHLGRRSTGLHELAGPDPPSLSAVPGQPGAAGGEDEVGKTEPDLEPSAETHLERGFSALQREASCTRAKGAGRLGPLAFPVTGSAPASPSPAAAGPFPESLKRREDWGAALPLAQTGGGAGQERMKDERSAKNRAVLPGLWFPGNAPKEDFYGPE